MLNQGIAAAIAAFDQTKDQDLARDNAAQDRAYLVAQRKIQEEERQRALAAKKMEGLQQVGLQAIRSGNNQAAAALVPQIAQQFNQVYGTSLAGPGLVGNGQGLNNPQTTRALLSGLMLPPKDPVARQGGDVLFDPYTQQNLGAIPIPINPNVMAQINATIRGQDLNYRSDSERTGVQRELGYVNASVDREKIAAAGAADGLAGARAALAEINSLQRSLPKPPARPTDSQILTDFNKTPEGKKFLEMGRRPGGLSQEVNAQYQAALKVFRENAIANHSRMTQSYITQNRDTLNRIQQLRQLAPDGDGGGGALSELSGAGILPPSVTRREGANPLAPR